MEHEVESMSVKIITDSTAYLPEDYLAQYDIDVVSLNVVMGRPEPQRDGIIQRYLL